MNILIEQEKALHQHETRQSPTETTRLLHPTFREVGRSGDSYSYSSIIKMMESEEPSSGYLHSQDYQCIKLEQTVYLILYKSAWVSDEGSISGFAKRSSIWIHEEDKWQMKYHQGTPCRSFELKN
ncbi:DUF4440 domain-containing protein [Vibrio marisflavi]|uniref:DUF4440 domain-containing protein n=1 Tax=Vibrio marisflavi CECT 7928 TaxID=634439 RepID=A0ABN8E1J6_9VIBR|nr:DUF4440 domain-containing protein [Vibrio marisflavi]CAH0536639.1 hypothetical protein VMF7928_00593 [Vibrio marisflavi CECT 7928]